MLYKLYEDEMVKDEMVKNGHPLYKELMLGTVVLSCELLSILVLVGLMF